MLVKLVDVKGDEFLPMSGRNGNFNRVEPALVEDQAGPPPESAPLINTAQIDGIVAAAGAAGAMEIMNAFWRTALQLIEQIESCVAAGDFSTAAAAGHALKGSAANVGAEALCKATRVLEEACRDGDAGAFGDGLANARRVYAETEDAFARHLAGEAPQA